MKSAIICGANSFVGRALTKDLLKNGYKVCALTGPNGVYALADAPALTVRSFSFDTIKDDLAFVLSGEYDMFFHLAWAGVSGEDRASPKVQLRNAQWTIDALNAAHMIGCRRFIAAGSIMENEALAACYTKGNKPGSGYVYGGGKVAAHIMSACMAAQLGIEVVWPKLINTYGPGEISTRMINTTLQMILKGESPTFTAATQNYDFVFIDDVAKAFRLIAERGKPFSEYIVGSSNARPLKEFLLEMKESIAPDLDFIFGDIPYTGINLPLSAFDCEETFEDTGFRAEIPFGEGIKMTLDWMRENNEKHPSFP